ncbi:hypothetical protein CXG81DRAFT_16543 [Caulochytrium protostelioides]|uniref:Uncharacterized protein n=1 Tax=Caulochytrium protostelioides TaxID=1555241 RepID=A0A4P9XEJ9_9FUNG|nr:hypothetical protein CAUPRSCDRAFT_10794 [Caulochytrium protostelioides]RKP03973.1 hypothetical protein CXG81DRAFT_16543 [Caulochytrium protostelioides]|eukprot:RKP03973.1 hypothetical protein CXG81DRAFT_16543 [Caulochytrium protostelioides]
MAVGTVAPRSEAMFPLPTPRSLPSPGPHPTPSSSSVRTVQRGWQRYAQTAAGSASAASPSSLFYHDGTVGSRGRARHDGVLSSHWAPSAATATQRPAAATLQRMLGQHGAATAAAKAYMAPPPRVGKPLPLELTASLPAKPQRPLPVRASLAVAPAEPAAKLVAAKPAVADAPAAKTMAEARRGRAQHLRIQTFALPAKVARDDGKSPAGFTTPTASPAATGTAAFVFPLPTTPHPAKAAAVVAASPASPGGVRAFPVPVLAAAAAPRRGLPLTRPPRRPRSATPSAPVTPAMARSTTPDLTDASVSSGATDDESGGAHDEPAEDAESEAAQQAAETARVARQRAAQALLRGAGPPRRLALRVPRHVDPAAIARADHAAWQAARHAEQTFSQHGCHLPPPLMTRVRRGAATLSAAPGRAAPGSAGRPLAASQPRLVSPFAGSPREAQAVAAAPSATTASVTEPEWQPLGPAALHAGAVPHDPSVSAGLVWEAAPGTERREARRAAAARRTWARGVTALTSAHGVPSLSASALLWGFDTDTDTDTDHDNAGSWAAA